MLAATWTTVSYTKERDPDVICWRENIKYSRLITILPRKARLNPFSGLFMHHSFHIYIHTLLRLPSNRAYRSQCYLLHSSGN